MVDDGECEQRKGKTDGPTNRQTQEGETENRKKGTKAADCHEFSKANNQQYKTTIAIQSSTVSLQSLCF